MISVFTFTRGREIYLDRLIQSIQSLGGSTPFEHHLCFQGVKPSRDLSRFLASIRDSYPLHIHLWEQNHGTGEGINRILPSLAGSLIQKLDEDAVIRSPDFFRHVEAVHHLVPEAVFSPYPVGLIDNPGGLLGGRKADLGRFVLYSQETDTYYTFRKALHVGGLARIGPALILKGFRWPQDLGFGHSGCEDMNFSKHCRENGIPLLYLENGLIVEHQESTLGQAQRYKSAAPSRALEVRPEGNGPSPSVSVIITTFNRKEKLKRAMDSVIGQSFTDWEMVVVDDHSTDGT